MPVGRSYSSSLSCVGCLYTCSWTFKRVQYFGCGYKSLTPLSTCCVQIGTCQTVFLYWFHHYENDRFIVSSNLPVAIARLRYFCKLPAFDLPKIGVALPLTEKPGQYKSKSCFYIVCFFSCRPERVLEMSGPTLHASKKCHTFKFIRLAIFILATWVSLYIIKYIKIE